MKLSQTYHLARTSGGDNDHLSISFVSLCVEQIWSEIDCECFSSKSAQNYHFDMNTIGSLLIFMPILFTLTDMTLRCTLEKHDLSSDKKHNFFHIDHRSSVELSMVESIIQRLIKKCQHVLMTLDIPK